jgi:hypothetical protein
MLKNIYYVNKTRIKMQFRGFIKPNVPTTNKIAMEYTF